jgi:DNA mismatch endonuclease (patch repair protein)
MDKLTKAARSALMSRVRSKDSKPELIVRSIVHRMGFRYRLHSSKLPGSPDLVFPARRKIVFVHGCFGTDTAAEPARTGQFPRSHTGIPNWSGVWSGTA